MVALTVMTWVRFLVWLDFGMIIYWFYGRTHSQLANKAEAAARTGLENLSNFLKMAGYMLDLQRVLHHAPGRDDGMGRDDGGAGQVARARHGAEPTGSGSTSTHRLPTPSA